MAANSFGGSGSLGWLSELREQLNRNIRNNRQRAAAKNFLLGIVLQFFEIGELLKHSYISVESLSRRRFSESRSVVLCAEKLVGEWVSGVWNGVNADQTQDKYVLPESCEQENRGLFFKPLAAQEPVEERILDFAVHVPTLTKKTFTLEA
jgi:hypothetical protein